MLIHLNVIRKKKLNKKVLLWFVILLKSSRWVCQLEAGRGISYFRQRAPLRRAASSSPFSVARSDRSSASRRSESERVLGVGRLSIGFIPVARRQALFRVVVLRVYPNVQHLGVSARLSESWEKHTHTENELNRKTRDSKHLHNISSGSDHREQGILYISKTPETTL